MAGRTHSRMPQAHSQQYVPSQLRNQLPLIPPLKQLQPSPRHILEFRLNNRLILTPNLDLPFLNCPDQLPNRLDCLMQKVYYDEALDLESHTDDIEVILHRERSLTVIPRDRATSTDSAVKGHIGKHVVEDLAADIIEIDVHAVAAGVFEVLLEGGGFVV